MSGSTANRSTTRWIWSEKARRSGSSSTPSDRTRRRPGTGRWRSTPAWPSPRSPPFPSPRPCHLLDAEHGDRHRAAASGHREMVERGGDFGSELADRSAWRSHRHRRRPGGVLREQHGSQRPGDLHPSRSHARSRTAGHRSRVRVATDARAHPSQPSTGQRRRPVQPWPGSRRRRSSAAEGSSAPGSDV